MKKPEKGSFNERVWELIMKVPKGKVTTYKEIANTLGVRAYRAVGIACNRSPGMPRVPCHRVVAADGRLHGYASGLDNKKRILEKEGLKMRKTEHAGKADYIVVDFDKKMHRFE